MNSFIFYNAVTMKSFLKKHQNKKSIGELIENIKTWDR